LCPVLAIINWRYLQRVDSQVEQNKVNINITRNKILQESYLKEMDSVLGPLKSRIGYFKYYEPLYLQKTDEANATEFRENIKKNKFLVPKKLRLIIEKYLLVCENQSNEIRKMRYEIREEINRMTKMAKQGSSQTQTSHEGPQKEHEIINLIGPAPVNEGYGTYIKNIEDWIKHYPNSDLSKKLSYFLDIAHDGHKYTFLSEDHSIIITSVELERGELEAAIKERYNYLEQKVEELRTEIEKDPTHVSE